jgi:hypothetical protein
MRWLGENGLNCGYENFGIRLNKDKYMKKKWFGTSRKKKVR